MLKKVHCRARIDMLENLETVHSYLDLSRAEGMRDGRGKEE